MKKETKDAMVLLLRKIRLWPNLLIFEPYSITNDVHYTFDNIFVIVGRITDRLVHTLVSIGCIIIAIFK